jgi:hypothetical protein
MFSHSPHGGVTARSAADLVGVNRKTAAYFFHRLRQLIAEQLEDALPVEGLIEVDESYLAAFASPLAPFRRPGYDSTVSCYHKWEVSKSPPFSLRGEV